MEAVTVSEAEYSRSDVAVLLESRRLERLPRGEHGHLLSEATDPQLKHLWDVPNPRRDFAAERLQKAQDAYYKAYPFAKDDRSLMWSVRMTPPATESGT